MRSIFAANFDLETVSNDDRVKSIWLGVLNPFFRDGSGGSVLRVKITGPRSNPAFGLDLRRHDKSDETTKKPALPRAN